MKRILLVTGLFIVTITNAQDKNTPKLKDQVALEISKLQTEVARINSELYQNQVAFLQKQNEIQGRGLSFSTALIEKSKTALRDSGIDETKYELDFTTLEVKEKKKP